MTANGAYRILIVDDLPAIHDDFRKILVPAASTPSNAAEAFETALFGEPVARDAAFAAFEVDSAYQGEAALACVQAALAAGRPYALAFVDTRMPPGWDGVETIERLWREDPRLQVVICTAFTDHDWDELRGRLAGGDRLLILKKPFDGIEVSQLAEALCAKYALARRAEAHVAELEAAVAARAAELEAEIAERKALESQLVQSEKLASLGQLAAGIAHEINNPLGFIVTNFGMLDRHLAALFELLGAYEAGSTPAAIAALCERIEIDFIRDDVPDLMRETKDGIVRVRQIVQDLKDFSRASGGGDWQSADLHAGIDSTLNIVASEVKYKAVVVREYGELPEVECLPAQINQVVMNLVVNAAHAMGERHGRIAVRTGHDGEHVWIEVADDGCGIAPEHLPRIFDPFFTTKPVGQGTGLGLAVSYGIVHKHRGEIAVASRPGEGTTFRVSLPVRQPAAEAA
jgi:two-component system, NtrC family, sensor kinase